jgi:hypothetical protein
VKRASQVLDAQWIASAVAFTTVRFKGRGGYDSLRFDALNDARGDRRAIVYSISPQGFTTHTINGDQIASLDLCY